MGFEKAAARITLGVVVAASLSLAAPALAHHQEGHGGGRPTDDPTTPPPTTAPPSSPPATESPLPVNTPWVPTVNPNPSGTGCFTQDNVAKEYANPPMMAPYVLVMNEVREAAYDVQCVV